LQVIADLTSPTVDVEVLQPDQQEIQSAVLNFAGTIVSYRGFSQSAPRKVRKISNIEFKTALASLAPDYGNVESIRVPRSSRNVILFLKKKPEELNAWEIHFCSLESYTAKYQCQVHSSITQNIRESLVREGVVSDDFFA
jgi:hypothetical protein